MLYCFVVNLYHFNFLDLLSLLLGLFLESKDIRLFISSLLFDQVVDKLIGVMLNCDISVANWGWNEVGECVLMCIALNAIIGIVICSKELVFYSSIIFFFFKTILRFSCTHSFLSSWYHNLFLCCSWSHWCCIK